MRVYRSHAPRLLFAMIVFFATVVSACAQTLSTPPEDLSALNAATRGLCNTQVAMLGESATHGDGHTLAFKVALVERLVDRCHFDAVFFEANQQEFIHLNRRLHSGDAVTSEDLLTAVGGIWKFYREFAPLAPFLLTRARSGQVFLGGLDDQLGQLGQSYANTEMVTELTELLPQPERQSCNTAIHNRIYSDYPDLAPYSEIDRSKIDACLEAIQAASSVDTTSSSTVKQERQQMISAIHRWVSRDFSAGGENMANRDRSMFTTFQWLESRLPKKHKVIVWAATVHIAMQGDPTWGDGAGTNFGSFVHRKYAKHARSLGFSALEGSFRQAKGNFPAIPIAPPNSVEAQALQASSASAVYVDPARLVAMGFRPGAFFYHAYQTLAWSEFLDCIVVFRTERPPTDTRKAF